MQRNMSANDPKRTFTPVGRGRHVRSWHSPSDKRAYGSEAAKASIQRPQISERCRDAEGGSDSMESSPGLDHGT
jgi:hypothetical protein